MSFIYCGFNVQTMLGWLHVKCTKVRLQKSDDQWTLYTYSEEFGEYENTGALTFIVMNAFKPFLPEAQAEVRRAKIEFGLTRSGN
ncbi:hypothetical protein [Pseudoalteromonas luteoviolacea]|uniref:hypothetical protein n=1 Tax=Pseudoalteromonas luteoviolacea TaxID=43657 RepID=UPI0011542DC6|nr:hypothetical protein [Pseudoalteromonas luteoviolacea]TQF69587.1 hypothetical protein FLM44_00270 [Pseudoalteromonas luteoviolacea]